MPTIEIDTQPYVVYSDVSQADEYVAGSFGDNADTWRSGLAADKERALISATRVLDKQQWLAAYDTFDERVDVENIVNASIEIAVALLSGSTLETDTTAQTQKRLKAGSVEIENFRGAEGAALRFPRNIQELIKSYIGGTATFGATAAGVDRESIFPLDLGFSKGL